MNDLYIEALSLFRNLLGAQKMDVDAAIKMSVKCVMPETIEELEKVVRESPYIMWPGEGGEKDHLELMTMNVYSHLCFDLEDKYEELLHENTFDCSICNGVVSLHHINQKRVDRA